MQRGRLGAVEDAEIVAGTYGLNHIGRPRRGNRSDWVGQKENLKPSHALVPQIGANARHLLAASREKRLVAASENQREAVVYGALD